jgi:hypothetical protein
VKAVKKLIVAVLCFLGVIAVIAVALFGLGRLFIQLADMSRVVKVVAAPGNEQALVFSQTDPSGNMSMVFLSVGFAPDKPFPAEGAQARGRIHEILAIAWDYKEAAADKIIFKWESAQRLSICTRPGTKIERFDAQAQDGYLQIHLCPEILEKR